MKRIINISAALMLLVALLAGCKKPEAKKATVVGCWELVNVETKSAKVGDTEVSVYVSFTETDFELYQMIGDGHYQKFTGTYTYAEGKLSGKYSGGASLGSVYDVTVDDSSMSLASSGGKEVDIYKKIAEIPSSVIDDVY